MSKKKLAVNILKGAGLVAATALAIVGAGQIFDTLTYDPEHGLNVICQTTLRGWDHALDLGWSA